MTTQDGKPRIGDIRQGYTEVKMQGQSKELKHDQAVLVVDCKSYEQSTALYTFLRESGMNPRLVKEPQKALQIINSAEAQQLAIQFVGLTIEQINWLKKYYEHNTGLKASDLIFG